MNRSHIQRGRADRQQGQSLVEFALVFPIFFVLLMGMIEFGLVFNAILSLNFATRDASLVAAEAGNAVGADCVVLKKVEQSIGAPASVNRINQVQIYKSDKNGNVVTGKVNTYNRSGSTSCPMPDGTTLVVPYTISGAAGYPETSRCNVVGGCGGSGAVDLIGVKINYTYNAVTPLGSFVGSSSTYNLVESNTMRMEPIL